MAAAPSIESARSLLLSRIAEEGKGLTALSPLDVLEVMFAFYQTVRFAEPELEEDGDMLLVQWGSHDWGHGLKFTFDVTRQFIVGSGEDDDFTQLHLTLQFEPTKETEGIAAHSHWCHHPSRVETSYGEVLNHPDFAVIGQLGATPGELSVEGV